MGVRVESDSEEIDSGTLRDEKQAAGQMIGTGD